jgi:hypothetical protein
MSRSRALVGFTTGAAVLLTGVLVAAPATAATLPAPTDPTIGHVATTADADGGDELFQWSPVLGASGYSLEVSTRSDFAAGSDVVPVVKTVLPAWVPTSPLGRAGHDAGGQTLYWRVAATSGSTTSAWSATQSFWEDDLAAPVPLGPGSTSGNAEVRYPTPVQFSWQPVPGATGYDVQYAPVTDTDFSSTATVSSSTTTATTWTPAAPLPRTLDGEAISWHWRVRARFYAGTATPVVGPWSTDQREFTVTWPSEASKPTLLEPAPSDGSSPTDPVVSDPLFRWTGVAGAGSYRLTLGKSRSDDHTTVTDVVLTTTVPTTTYVLTDPLLDQQYFWQVTPLDTAAKDGTPSDVQEFIKRWGSQPGPTTTNEYATAYPVPLIGSTSPDDAPQIPVDRFEVSWSPLARTAYYEVEVSAVDGTSTLTCATASTSATIFAGYAAANPVGGTPGALRQNGASCLWSGTVAKQIQAGQTYRWRVRGVQTTAKSTSAIGTASTGSIYSAWSDPRSLDYPDRARYVTAGPAQLPTTSVATLDDSATSQAAAGEPAPLLTWQPVLGASYYTVQIGLNSELDTNPVATFKVPGTSLRATGVFADNQVNMPYYWRVYAMASPITSSTAITLGDWSNTSSWSKTSTATSFDGVVPVTQLDGTTLLRWTPQAISAPQDGGSRGYQITIRNNAGTVIGAAQKVTYPFFVAANPSTGKTLTPGRYSFTVQPLDATGASGRASAAQTFDIDGSAPTGSRATAAGSGETLSWNPSPGAASYRVVATIGSTTKPAVTTSQTAVTLADLAPGAYSWTVTPTDSLGVVGSPASSSFTIEPRAVTTRTTGTEPATGAVVSWQSPALDWAPLAGAARYVVKITNASGTTIESAETAATSYVPGKALAYGTQYQWQVSAVPELATTSTTRAVLGQSAVVPFTFSGAPGTPSTPRLTLTNGTTVTASWPALTGAALGSATPPAYVVQYGVVNAATGVPDAWLPPSKAQNTLSLAVSGLLKGVTYAFQVRAQNDLGTSAWSTQAKVTTGTVPGVPRNATATPTGVGALKIAWSSPTMTTGSPTVSGYVVTYAIGTATAKTVTVATTSTTITGLTGRSTYTVTVAAKNALGTGPKATLTAVPYSAASAPHSVKVVRGDRSATVTWTKPTTNGGSAITGYVVQLSTYSASTKKWSAWVSKSTTTATTYKAVLTGLVNGTSYHVRVYAKTTPAPVGTASATLSVVPAGKPLAPSSVKVAVAKGSAKVTWKKPSANGSAITSYVLQYSTNGRTWSTKAYPKASATSYTWSKPSKGKTYYVRIYAKSAVGSGTVSASVRFVAK